MNPIIAKAFEIGVKQAFKMLQNGNISPTELLKNGEAVMKTAEKIAKAAAKAK